MKQITDEEAIKLLGTEPEDFYTYYIFPTGNMYIIRIDSSLYYCNIHEANVLIHGF